MKIREASELLGLEVCTIIKNGDVVEFIKVPLNDTIAAALYEKTIEKAKTLEDLKHIIEVAREDLDDVNKLSKTVTDFEKVSDVLYLRAQADEFPPNVYSFRRGPLYCCIYIDLDGAVINVTNELIKTWGVHKLKLRMIAADNTSRNIRIGGLTGELGVFESVCPFKVVTAGKFGSGILASPNCWAELRKEFPDGCYILPSSIYEILVIPDSKYDNGYMLSLSDMVKSVNKEQVAKQDILGYNAYYLKKEGKMIWDIDTDW